MDTTRTQVLKDREFSGESVVYVMSRDQRSHDNHALLAALDTAKKHNVPLFVLFVLKAIAPRSREHYTFMMDGLSDVQSELASFGIPLVIRIGNPVATILEFCAEVKAGALYFDFSPLAGARRVSDEVSVEFTGSVKVVDTHNIIPAWVASAKQEFAAHTMRTKVHRLLGNYLISPALLTKQDAPRRLPFSVSFAEATAYITTLPVSGISVVAPPGEKAAKVQLQKFISRDLAGYATTRNDIAADTQSGLSSYLHFGQISSLRVALDVIDAVGDTPLLLREPKLAQAGDALSERDGMDTLLEEMIVRKELSDNFCYYARDYRSLVSVPEWAQASLAEHSADPRDFTYTRSDWEKAATHDSIWNAAQIEMMSTGKMHGYMRMYWAKKILEWSASPGEAIETAIFLNDKYSIDGGDPNGYVGILWSIAGLHDRPWFERPVYGKIRYMNASGLRRKFNVDAYIARVNPE